MNRAIDYILLNNMSRQHQVTILMINFFQRERAYLNAEDARLIHNRDQAMKKCHSARDKIRVMFLCDLRDRFINENASYWRELDEILGALRKLQ